MVAVLDWELSTLGHPMGDLAWACRAYHCPPGIDGVSSFQGIDRTRMEFRAKRNSLPHTAGASGERACPI